MLLDQAILVTEEAPDGIAGNRASTRWIV